MKYLSLPVFLILGLIANQIMGQTKMIAYKSHSGSAALMNEVLLADMFSAPNSNLGAAPERLIRNAQLDSLIFLDDTSTVMVTSNNCVTFLFDSKKANNKSIWQAGRDTVRHHNVFNKKLTEDSIREIINTTYNFDNDANDIVFVNHQLVSAIKQLKEENNPKKTSKNKGTKKKKKTRKNTKNKNAKKSLFKKPGCTTFFFICCVITVSVGAWKNKTP